MQQLNLGGNPLKILRLVGNRTADFASRGLQYLLTDGASELLELINVPANYDPENPSGGGFEFVVGGGGDSFLMYLTLYLTFFSLQPEVEQAQQSSRQGAERLSERQHFELWASFTVRFHDTSSRLLTSKETNRVFLLSQISGHGCTGPFPQFLYRLPSLVDLDLSYNNFSGSRARVSFAVLLWRDSPHFLRTVACLVFHGEHWNY